MGIAILLFLFAMFVFMRGSYRGHVTPFGERIAPLVQEGANELARQIPSFKETKLNPVVVFPFAGPKGARLADEIRKALDARGAYDVIGQGAAESFIRNLNIDLPQLPEEETRKYAAKLGAKAFVTGLITEMDEMEDPPAFSFQAVFAATNGEFRREFSISALTAPYANALPVDGGGRSVGNTLLNAIWNIVAYFALCLATPLLLYPITRNLLVRRDNFVNGLMLLGYSVADTLVLGIAWGAGPWTTAGGFTVAVWLNYIVCDLLERKITS
ncbi:MAG: hypothetical protein FWG74_04745 [Planctomycetes bacterium]|nr:hypothetical protein [Planctomycetota bacterium]